MCTTTLADHLTPFEGLPQMVTKVREHVAERLGADHPALATVELVVSELVNNAIMHTRSGDGGTVWVLVEERDGYVRVDVLDQGSDGEPRIVTPRDLAIGGRGLWIVSTLTADWGTYQHDLGKFGPGHAVWADIYPPAD